MDYSVYDFNRLYAPRRALKATGSVTLTLGDGVLEPDCSYTNLNIPLQIAPRDDNNTLLPNIIVEVSYSETYQSIFSTVPVYFRSAHIRAVLIICLVSSSASQEQGQPSVNQMIAILYSQAISTESAACAISLGLGNFSTIERVTQLSVIRTYLVMCLQVSVETRMTNVIWQVCSHIS